MKQALYMTLAGQEIFFPKVEFTKSTVEIFYYEDVQIINFSAEERLNMTAINMVPEGTEVKSDIREILIPNSISVFEKWYSELVSMKLIHLSLPKTCNSYVIYWNKFPNGYGELINFDILEEILRFQNTEKNVQFYKNNTNKKLNFIGKL